MRQLSMIIFILSFTHALWGQDSLNLKSHTIGIEYFGELGFHPGVKIDIGFTLWVNNNLKAPKKRSFYQLLNIRPNLNYYYLPKYTNNFLLGTDLGFQFLSINNTTKKYFFIESYFGAKYMRYSYIGTIYESNNTGGFTEKERGGGNALLINSGLLVGGVFFFKNVDWIAGAEYFVELPEDKLIIHHPAARLGIRLKLN